MSKKTYYYSEFSEGHPLRPLKQRVINVYEGIGHVLSIYDVYHSEPSFGTKTNPKLFGMTSGYTGCLRKLNEIRFVMTCEEHFLRTLKHDSSLNRPKTSNPVPVKINTNLKEKRLLFPSEGCESRDSVIISPKQLHTPVKPSQSFPLEPCSSPKEYASLTSDDDGVSQIVQIKQRKKITPVKEQLISKKADIFFQKNSSLVQKEINYDEPVKVQSHLPIKKRTLIYSPEKIDKEYSDLITEIGGKYDNPVVEESNKPYIDEKFEKTDEAAAISPVLSVIVKSNQSPYKEVSDIGIYGDGKNISTNENTTTFGIRKSFGSTEDIQGSMSKKKEYSPVNKTSTPSNPTTKSHKSVFSDNNITEMTTHTYQDSERNITPSKLSKNSDRKRKSPSPRSDNVHCKSMPKKMHSPGGTEPDMSFTSTSNPSHTTPSTSRIENKSAKAAESDTINTEKPLRDILKTYKPKPRKTSSLPTATDSSPITDYEMKLLRIWIMYIPPENLSSILSSPEKQSLDSNASKYCVFQFKTLHSKRQDCLQKIFNGLLHLKKNLEHLCYCLDDATHILHTVSVIRADYVTIDIQERILRLLNTATKLVTLLAPLKMRVSKDLQKCNMYLQLIRELPSKYKDIPLNSTHPELMEFLKEFEADIKKIWINVDKTIEKVGVRISNILSSEENFKKFLSCFVVFLIKVGLIKE